MKIIVAGGSGFVGSHFILYMVGKYSKNIIINLDITGSMPNLKSVEGMPNYRFIRGDIENRAFVFKVFDMEEPDIVINFVSDYSRNACDTKSKALVRMNTAGIENLLEASRLLGVKRYHQVSTEEVYGPRSSAWKNRRFAEEYPICTSDADSPDKAYADLMVQEYYKLYQLPITISRCSDNYGPCCYAKTLISMAVMKALKLEPIVLHGNGETVRDWIYVADHCRALDLILNEGRIGEIYNIGSPDIQTDLDVVRLILNMLNRPERLIAFSDKDDEKAHSLVNTDKITREMGWIPSYDFETGLRKTVHWYVTHQT